MDRVSLAIFHQQRAEELYAFARWAGSKGMRAKERFAVGDFILRRNQCILEADLAAKHAATARLLMGIEDNAC